MIFFGHLGITLGVAGAVDKIVLRSRKDGKGIDIDYRFLLLGSLLPDLIDKTVLFFLNNQQIKSGKMFGHSLIFLLIIAGAGLAVRQKFKKPQALVLAVGSLTHLLLDEIWNHMNAFLWPVFAGEQDDMSWLVLKDIVTDPHLYVPEITGLVMLSFFTVFLVRRKQLRNFIRTGKITWHDRALKN